MRPAGGGNRGTEAARDQVAAASPDGADKSERSRALDAGRFRWRASPARVARAHSPREVFPRGRSRESC